MADVERTRRILAIELLLKRIMTLQHEQDVARETIADKDKLIERPVKYTDHYSGCPSEASNYSDDCTCGYTALMKEIGDTDGKD